MFTTESPIDLRFIYWAYPIIQDIRYNHRVEWLDSNTLEGSRTGTFRGYIDDGGDDIRQAIVRVTLDSGRDHEVLLVDLMTASQQCGYARR